ncbi:MAG: hypothetical protein JXB38_20405 [Anaerolineales bacterium]|nr:hypothetical protein [Anaerolineales bacterium]
MSFTLSDLLQGMYSGLGQLQVGQASGGEVDALVDETLAGQHADDEWKGGTLFVAAADGEAPEGAYGRVAGYEGSSGTFTLGESLGAAVAAGDIYGLASAYYPLMTMIELANAALRALGDIALVDTVAPEAGSVAGEYTAALAWKRRRPLRIDEVSGNQVVTRHDWEYIPAAPGQNGAIGFESGLTAGCQLRVWYVDVHPRLRVFDDVVSETIAPELAVAAGVVRALQWQQARQEGHDPGLAAKLESADDTLLQARLRFPIWMPRRRARLLAIPRA